MASAIWRRLRRAGEGQAGEGTGCAAATVPKHKLQHRSDSALSGPPDYRIIDGAVVSVMRQSQTPYFPETSSHESDVEPARGRTETLTIEECRSAPRRGQVLLAVKACGVNIPTCSSRGPTSSRRSGRSAGARWPAAWSGRRGCQAIQSRRSHHGVDSGGWPRSWCWMPTAHSMPDPCRRTRRARGAHYGTTSRLRSRSLETRREADRAGAGGGVAYAVEPERLWGRGDGRCSREKLAFARKKAPTPGVLSAGSVRQGGTKARRSLKGAGGARGGDVTTTGRRRTRKAPCGDCVGGPFRVVGFRRHRQLP